MVAARPSASGSPCCWHLGAALRDRAGLPRRARPRPPRAPAPDRVLPADLGRRRARRLFNALLAPLVFPRAVEYPLAMVLACVLSARPRPRQARPAPCAAGRGSRAGVAALALVLYSESATLRVDFSFLPASRPSSDAGRRLARCRSSGRRQRGAHLRPPLLAACSCAAGRSASGSRWPRCCWWPASSTRATSDQISPEPLLLRRAPHSRAIATRRTTPSCAHGTTLHGRQSLEPSRRAEPLSYYQRNRPIGQLFVELDRRAGASRWR